MSKLAYRSGGGIWFKQYRRHEDGETGIHHTTLLHLITESSLSLARTHGKYKALRCAAPRGCVVRCCPGAETEGRKREGGLERRCLATAGREI